MKKINNKLDKQILRFSLIFGFIIAISAMIYLQTQGKLFGTELINYKIEDKEEKDKIAIRDLIEHFGRSLKNVSLSSSNIKEEITQNYKDFVSQELIQQWQQNPSQAPGRLVSSPWPDRIEISEIKKINEATYIIYGNIIEVTSVEQINGEIAAQRNITLTAVKINNN